MSRSRAATGVGLVLGGVIFLLDALAIIDLWAPGAGWWPALIVVLGIVLVLRRAPEAPAEPSRAVVSVLAARSVEATERPYRGGRVVTVLGSASVDLRSTSLADDGAVLSVTTVVGGVTVTVPPGWRVEVRPRALLTDVGTDLLPASDDGPTLLVTGTAILSDVVVRSGSVVA